MQDKNSCIYFKNSVNIFNKSELQNSIFYYIDVENVLIIVAVNQNNPLALFDTFYFNVIVERAKV